MRPGPTDPTNSPNEDPAPPQEVVQRRGLAAYQGAFEAVLAIPIAIGGGYWLDGRFDTTPILLLVGAVVGFGAFVLRLLRLHHQLQNLDDEPQS
jgi:F0F1-type ATP synthase assembly protein I